jgi:CRP-like cAMP-binding protein
LDANLRCDRRQLYGEKKEVTAIFLLFTCVNVPSPRFGSKKGTGMVCTDFQPDVEKPVTAAPEGSCNVPAAAAGERDFLSSIRLGFESRPASTMLVVEGDPHGRLYRIRSGWAQRFKVLRDGRRRVLDFLIEGDFVGLDCVLGEEFGYSVEAITDLRYVVYNATRLQERFATDPMVALRLGRAAAIERQRLDQHLISIGPRCADERVAALLLQCYRRLEARGLASGDVFALPLTQLHMADYLGITLVHTNRVLRRLQERGLITLKNREVTIHHRRALGRLAILDDEAEPLIGS